MLNKTERAIPLSRLETIALRTNIGKRVSISAVQSLFVQSAAENADMT